MKQKLGSWVVDILTPGEHKAQLDSMFSQYLRDKYRGENYLGFTGLGNGTNQVLIPGPDSGYAWAPKLLAVQCSAATSVVSVYPGENITVAPIGVTTTVANSPNNDAVITWTSNVVVLQDNRSLTIYTGTATSTILNWRLLVKQVPAEMIGKL